jgi:hypothetical protein
MQVQPTDVPVFPQSIHAVVTAAPMEGRAARDGVIVPTQFTAVDLKIPPRGGRFMLEMRLYREEP